VNTRHTKLVQITTYIYTYWIN